MGDTSLVFNLIAKDKLSAGLKKAGEGVKKATLAIGAAGGAALAYGVTSALDFGAAQAKVAGQLGLTSDESAKMGKLAGSLYSQNFGGSMEDVDAALVSVKQNLGDVAKAGKGSFDQMTKDALTFSSTFDQDVGGVTAAVSQMLRTGLAKDATEAFDVLTKGFQNGANKADDLLDTFNEYGTQFRKLGLDGKEAMGLISQGLKGGARDADIVADALKEFAIRAVDGSKTTAAGFKMIGLNGKEMAAAIGAGGEDARTALKRTLDAIKAIKDPTLRSQAAVQLFGTQAEDLGDALYALDLSGARKQMDGMAGSTKRMTEAVGNNPAAQLETFKRQAQMALTDIGGALVSFGMANSQFVKPLVIGLGTLAAAVLLVQGGMMTYTAVMNAWRAAQVIATAVQWAFNTALLASPITWIVLAIVALIAIIVLMVTHWDLVKRVAVATWDVIWGATKAVGSYIAASAIGIGRMLMWPWEQLGKAHRIAVNAVWSGLKWLGSNVFNWKTLLTVAILGPWAPFKNQAIGAARAVWGGLSWLQGKTSGFVSAVGRILSRIGDAIIAPFRRGINSAKSMWNSSIGSLHFSVPDWVPGFGGGSFSFPALAEGGIVTGPTLALVGEAGPEAVVPLDQYRGAQEAGSGAARSEVSVKLELDLRGADEALLRALRKMIRPRGGSAEVVLSS